MKTCVDALGSTPQNQTLFPVLSQEQSLSNSPQQQLLDQRYIQRMFADGALGGLWLPEPQYLYEDSAGTLPASTNGVCGLWLDCSRDLALGSELVTNGTFDTDLSGWSVFNVSRGTFVATNGQLVATNNGSNSTGPTLEQSLATTQGARYRVTGQVISSTTAQGVRVRIIADGATSLADFYYTSGSIDFSFIANRTATIAIWIYSNNINNISVLDNISVREILDAHAIQATLANKPTLRRTPISGKYWLDSNNINATGAMTATFPSSLGSACTVARANADGVTITPAQTITTTYNLTPPYGYSSAVMVINRALTASETAVVSRYLRNWVPVLGAELLKNTKFESANDWVTVDTFSPPRGTVSIENGLCTIVDNGETTASGNGYHMVVITQSEYTIGSSQYCVRANIVSGISRYWMCGNRDLRSTVGTGLSVKCCYSQLAKPVSFSAPYGGTVVFDYVSVKEIL